MSDAQLKPLSYSGQLTLQDWLGAYKHHGRSYQRTLLEQAVLYGWATALFALIARTRATERGLAIVVLAGIFMSLLLQVRATRSRFSAAFLQSPVWSRPFSTNIDDAGFSSSGEFFNDRRPWQSLKSWKETSELILLYESQEAFRIIPKRVLGTQENVASLRAWLAQKLGPAEAHFDLGA